MAFQETERAQLYLRCALFGPSGSGKTIAALRMAKGIAGKMGCRFAVIDTEARSASKSTRHNSFQAWGKVSPKQKALVEAILNFPGHIIATMRSKTEWCIGAGKDGKMSPEKVGLAPEQCKGIKHEFDMLVELN